MATFAAAFFGAVSTLATADCSADTASVTISKTDEAPEEKRELPVFSKAEVAAHAGGEAGVWVILGDKVYDVTSFLENHPGGAEKLMTAAGKSLEPYWALYRQHVQPGSAGAELHPKDHVAEILAPLQIGWLDPADVAAAAAARSDDDPYAKEPARSPMLRMLSETPCSAESPPSLMLDHYVTPNELFFVRNHHPVPVIDGEDYNLLVSGRGIKHAKEYSLHALKALPKTTLTATIQCGGNRRDGLNPVRKTSGNAWGVGAISNATWGGVLLRDLLNDAGLADAGKNGVAHVQFEGEDGTKASIPATKATSELGDVIVAYEMNGEPIPADHGFPVRVVVPGHVGVRNIKWLRKVITSDEEAEGVWQRGIAYKQFGPSVTNVDGLDLKEYAPMQEMPVQSAILSPMEGAKVDGDETITVQGFAWSGGGRNIARVDVSADDGVTWHTAKLKEGKDQPPSRAWAWTFWEAEVPPPKTASSTTLICKAVDVAHNSQPESAASVWNLRGLANNSWHRVDVQLQRDA